MLRKIKSWQFFITCVWKGVIHIEREKDKWLSLRQSKRELNSASLPWLHTQKPVWYLGWWDVRDCAHLWPFRRSTKCEHSVRGEETLGHAPTHVDSYQTKLDVISTKQMTLSEPKVTSRDVCSALHFSNILECAQGTSCKTPQKRP